VQGTVAWISISISDKYSNAERAVLVLADAAVLYYNYRASRGISAMQQLLVLFDNNDNPTEQYTCIH